MEKIIIVDDKKLHLVFGKTKPEWIITQSTDDCWSFPIEEMLDGTIEINEDIWYWLIDGRCYETNNEVIN